MDSLAGASQIKIDHYVLFIARADYSAHYSMLLTADNHRAVPWRNSLPLYATNCSTQSASNRKLHILQTSPMVIALH
jgi:hypothetical protein